MYKMVQLRIYLVHPVRLPFNKKGGSRPPLDI